MPYGTIFTKSAKTAGETLTVVGDQLTGGFMSDYEIVSALSGNFNPDVYETRHIVFNGGSVVCFPGPTQQQPLTVGQRHLFTYMANEPGGAPSDTLLIAGPGAQGNTRLVIEGRVASGVTNYASTRIHPGVVLRSGGDQALFEYRGLSGAVPEWNLLYLTGSATYTLE
jgi:hypothetical protein